MDGSLRPAARFKVPLIPVNLESGTPEVSGDAAPVNDWLWTVQEQAEQTDVFECSYSLLRDRPEHCPEARYYWLPEALTLSSLIVFAVVFDEDVKAIDTRRCKDPDKEQDARERTSQDRLNVIFAVEHLGWKPHDSGDLHGLTELLEGGEAYGQRLSLQTARRIIKESWERLNPVMAE